MPTKVTRRNQATVRVPREELTSESDATSIHMKTHYACEVYMSRQDRNKQILFQTQECLSGKERTQNVLKMLRTDGKFSKINFLNIYQRHRRTRRQWRVGLAKSPVVA